MSFNRPFIVGKELFYIAQAVLIQEHLSGDGLYTKKCHHWLENRLGCRKSLLTHSCTAALEMAAILCDLLPGDEVIMPSFTFVSTANAFVLRGAVPVFVDIRPDTLNLAEELIPAATTPKTKAVVPVHYAGVACAMKEIMEIAAFHGLFVVEDAAQSLLSTFEGRQLGTIGHLGCLSFHETKNIISGEGGALLINDESLIERAEILWQKGTDRNKFLKGEVDKYTWVDIGSSYLPSELVGAFLYAQLEHADEILNVRRHLFECYYKALSPLQEQGLLRLPFVSPDCEANGHLFYIITRSLEERNRLIQHLKTWGINSAFHYVPLHSSMAGKKYGRAHGDMSVTNLISDCLLRLPMYYEMMVDDIYHVAEALNHFYRRF
jgi:dTDP-4-amino-4,6-dideoxygalactose transaminase